MAASAASLMERLFPPLVAKSLYVDRQATESPEEQLAALETTSTVYVGNLSPTTPEELVWELFRKVGEVRRVIMGLDRNQMTPYGFCFVEYHSREGAACALRVMNGLKLDERAIQVDWDRGFRAGRQYGRARAPRNDGGRPGWRQHDKRPYERDHHDERNPKRQHMGRPDE